MKTAMLISVCIVLVIGTLWLLVVRERTPHALETPLQPLSVIDAPQVIEESPTLPSATTSTPLPYGRPYTYTLGQSQTYSDGQTLTLTTITDSRCKPEVTCIWAGELAPTFTVVVSKAKPTVLTLGSVRATTTTVGGMRYTLINVTENEATIIVAPATVTTAPKAPVVQAVIATKRSIQPASPDPDASFITALRLAIEKETNAFRRSRGLPALDYLPELATNADRYSRHLQQYSYLSHTDRTGCDMSCRFDKDNFTSSAIGENLAMMSFDDRPDVDDVASFFMTQWEKSAGHRDNLLSELFTHQGIGVSLHDSSVYVTVHFAREE